MSKNFQEKFTEASRIYLALEGEIREMYRFDTNPRIKLDDAIKSFDLLVQLIFLNLCALDNNVSEDELKFIKKLTVEEDILDFINEKKSDKIEWSQISSANLNSEQYRDFLEYVSNAASLKINSFIMLLASIDTLTKKDYLYRFKQGFKELTMFFVSANSDKDYNYEVDQILNKTFIYKYRSLKTIFSMAKNEEVK